MKRTITEILIHVEETIAIRKPGDKAVNDAETITCPQCGFKIVTNGQGGEGPESQDAT